MDINKVKYEYQISTKWNDHTQVLIDVDIYLWLVGEVDKGHNPLTYKDSTDWKVRVGASG